MTELFLHILMKCVEDSRVIHYRPHAVSAFSSGVNLKWSTWCLSPSCDTGWWSGSTAEEILIVGSSKRPRKYSNSQPPFPGFGSPSSYFRQHPSHCWPWMTCKSSVSTSWLAKAEFLFSRPDTPLYGQHLVSWRLLKITRETLSVTLPVGQCKPPVNRRRDSPAAGWCLENELTKDRTRV